MAKGRVKWFNNAKGYGFIRMEGESEDIFVHYSNIRGPKSDFKTLKADERVEFQLNRGPKGLHTTDVARVDAVELEPA